MKTFLRVSLYIGHCHLCYGGSPKITLTVLLNRNWHVINREEVYLRNKVPPLSSSPLAVIPRDLNAGFHQSWIPFRSISFRKMIYKSRVNHIRWNFRNDCTEFVRSFSMILWNCKLFPFFAKPLNKPHKHQILKP